MATGYTYPVKEGKVTEFSDFVWDCARAFGALVSMRDDPFDAKIPAEFEPESHYVDRVRACEFAKEEVRKLIRSDEYAEFWSTSGMVIGKQINTWLTENRQALLESTVMMLAGQAAQNVINNMPR